MLRLRRSAKLGHGDVTTWVFDFDFTLVDFETLESLADISLDCAADAEARRAEIARLTDPAMAGEIHFGEGLTRRLALLPLTRAMSRPSPPAHSRRNSFGGAQPRFFREHADRIVIVSGGFREVIAPVAERLGIAPERVLANDLLYGADGRVTGVDDNPLPHAVGKAEGALEAMHGPWS